MASSSLRLIADIGGTHARFALAEPEGAPFEERKLLVASYPGIVEAASDYLAGRRAREAVFAVATPVEGDAVAFTNNPWRFSIAEVRARLGLDSLAVINDFMAQALAVARLAPEDAHPIKAGEPVARRPAIVIGPGTGLGVALLVHEAAGVRALPSEGGHVSFAPADELQTDLLRVLRRRFRHVSNERILSGPGLVHLAQALAELRNTNLDAGTPADVVARAADGSCPVCADTVRVFSSVLGSAAGDLALVLLARGGIFVVGGLCRRLGPLLDPDAFRHGFVSKGRFEPYLETIPAFQVLREHTGLLGAAAYDLAHSE